MSRAIPEWAVGCVYGCVYGCVSLGAYASCGWALEACGASTATRASYSVEAARCIANERAIVDRVGTSEELDHADLEAERARCDHELRLIEGSTP